MAFCSGRGGKSISISLMILPFRFCCPLPAFLKPIHHNASLNCRTQNHSSPLLVKDQITTSLIGVTGTLFKATRPAVLPSPYIAMIIEFSGISF
jgi:hypothetical protein